MVDRKIQAKFEAFLGPQAVLVPPHDLSPFSQDASRIAHRPDIVLQPQSTSQVADIFRLAHEHRLPLTSRGGGTGLDGGAVAARGGLVISMARMNQVREISAVDMVAVVQPGVISARINDHLRPHGLFYPIDPASRSRSTIGGDVATKAHGLRSIKYGSIANFLLGLEVVVPPGEIIRCGARTLKCATGYHLTDLFAGSRGRLGTITEIILKPLPRPSAQASLMAILERVDQALEIKKAIRSRSIWPSRMELLDAQAVQSGLTQLRQDLSPGRALLLVELDGPVRVVKKDVQVILRLLSHQGARQTRLAKSEQEVENWWRERGSLLSHLVGQRDFALLMTVGIPGSATARFFDTAAAVSIKPWRFQSIYGHLGEGRWHCLFLAEGDPAVAARTLPHLIQALLKAASSMDGRILRRHTIGLPAGALPPAARDPGQQKLWKALKERIDPETLLNPLG